mmetsp:Transcript_134503/g.326887  ORF Transcript_134503/g.326887 Transcript_134503/m.326887 type:complete len:286 (-) Transcript_134503:4475-5332(-)
MRWWSTTNGRAWMVSPRLLSLATVSSSSSSSCRASTLVPTQRSTQSRERWWRRRSPGASGSPTASWRTVTSSPRTSWIATPRLPLTRTPSAGTARRRATARSRPTKELCTSATSTGAFLRLASLPSFPRCCRTNSSRTSAASVCSTLRVDTFCTKKVSTLDRKPRLPSTESAASTLKRTVEPPFPTWCASTLTMVSMRRSFRSWHARSGPLSLRPTASRLRCRAWCPLGTTRAVPRPPRTVSRSSFTMRISRHPRRLSATWTRLSMDLAEIARSPLRPTLSSTSP